MRLVILAALLAIVTPSHGQTTFTPNSRGAYEASRVLKDSAGTLLCLTGYNSKTSSQFIQIFDARTLPANGAAPIATFIVEATSNFSYSVPMPGLQCRFGITVSNSSTGPTKTIGAADCYFTAVIR